jgi:hypothetical protein
MSDTVNSKVVKEIQEKSDNSTGMYVQKIYKDTLRNLINIFGNSYYIDRDGNSVKIKCFHANQERAVAKSTLGDNITLPVITIAENNSSNNDNRRRYYPILIHDKYWHKKKNRAIRILSMAPRPIDIKYTINIWSKYKEDLDQIREFVIGLFNPDLEINTKQSNITKAYFDSESDIERSEANDQEDRILKKSITIKVETYVENPKFLYTSTGKIEQLNYELQIMDSPISELAAVKAVTESHAEVCLCSDCAILINTISGQQFNLASCQGTATCECLNCLLNIATFDGPVVSIPIDCTPINDIGTL